MQKYTQLSKLLSKALNERTSLKNIVFNCSRDQSFIRQSYALLSKIMSHYDKILDVLQQILSIEPIEIFDQNLLIVLMVELFNSENRKPKKIGGKLTSYLKRHKDLIVSLLESYGVFNKVDRFVHLRELVPMEIESTRDEHIKELIKVNYKDYSEYLKQHPASNDFIVQGKSSALPAWLLLRHISNHNLNIIDCCSAPGNKTIQLCHYAKQNNLNGKVYAIEKDESRFKVLSNRLTRYGCDNGVPINMDFLQTNPNDFDVKLALLDPSCSGSGMVQQRQLQSTTDLIDVPESKRSQVESLSQMQYSMLTHLTKFKKLKCISYSTCSIYREENEDVANRFIRDNPQWKAVKLFPEWPHRGLGNQNYVRVAPGETDGFFIAMFKKVKQ